MAAHQAGQALTPAAPAGSRLELAAWRTIVADIGIPVGRPQTVTVDLAGRLRPGEHEVRIVTNMRIYWDQRWRRLPCRSSRPADPPRRADDRDARQRAASRRRCRPDGQEPPLYDYARVTRVIAVEDHAGPLHARGRRARRC